MGTTGEAEFAAFYRRWMPTVRAIAASRFPHDADRQDEAVQEAFLDAHRHFDRLAALDNPRWLVRCIARQACGTVWRKHRRWAIHAVPTDPHAAALDAHDRAADDPTMLAEDAALRELRRAAVRDALDAVEPKQREAFMLRAVDGLAYSEIERLTGRSADALRSGFKRARRAVADAYAAAAELRELVAAATSRTWIRAKRRLTLRPELRGALTQLAQLPADLAVLLALGLAVTTPSGHGAARPVLRAGPASATAVAVLPAQPRASKAVTGAKAKADSDPSRPAARAQATSDRTFGNSKHYQTPARRDAQVLAHDDHPGGGSTGEFVIVTVPCEGAPPWPQLCAAKDESTNIVHVPGAGTQAAAPQ